MFVILRIGLKQSHMYANIDIRPHLRRSGILETSEFKSAITTYNKFLIQNLK